jgi:hypothetical protein
VRQGGHGEAGMRHAESLGIIAEHRCGGFKG